MTPAKEASFKRYGALTFCAIIFLSTLAACANRDAAAEGAANRAQILLEENRIFEARQAINEAIASRDSEPSYHILRGRIEFAAGSVPAAFNAYYDAKSLDPQNFEALQAVAQLGLQIGRFREAEEASETLIALSPNNIAALQVRGLLAMAQKRSELAESYADRILEIDPLDEGGTILKARLAFLLGSPQDALVVLDRFSTEKSNTVGISLTRLEISRATRNKIAMAKQFNLLRSLRPEDSALRLDESYFWFKQGDTKKGLQLTVRVMSASDTSAEFIEAIIAMWTEFGVTGLSGSLIDKIAETGSRSAIFETAKYLIEHEQFSSVVPLVEGLDGFSKFSISALLAEHTGQRELASQLAARVLAHDQTNCLALTVRARLKTSNGQARSAVIDSQQAATECPQSAEAWFAAATAYSTLDDPENARRMWRQGIDANQQNHTLSSLYIDWLVRMGRPREAVAEARRLTNVTPASTAAWKLYLETCSKTTTSCEASARKGLLDASTRYGVDLLPGERQPNGLLGRLIVQ